MGWCVRCGNHFIIATGKRVTRPVVTQGRMAEIKDSVCPSCLKPGERYGQ